jgi:PKD domain-containing protein
MQPEPQPPGTPGSSSGLQPTTTLSAETGNNTSAADSFSQPTNGIPGAGNVSKVPISTLLYQGATTKIYAHLMGWFGGTNHMNVGYRSDDAAQVKRQVDDMMSRGIQGVIIDWTGPSSRPDATAMLMMKEAEARNGFEFAIVEDAGALFAAAQANQCDVTSQVISDLNYIATQFQNSPAYIKINSRPVVFFFGVDTYYVDWNRVASSVPNNPLLLFRGKGGLSHAATGGGFQWVDLVTGDPFDPQLSAQDQFYSSAVANPSLVSVGSAYAGFNDTMAPWSTNRFIHQRCGQTWLDTFGEISKFYSSSHQLTALQLVTWNDYEEGSAIETGIDNCVYLTPSISGSTLQWTVAGGSEGTLDHYTVFASTDGQNLAKLGDVATGKHSFDLSSLAANTYTLFVQAVGRASVRNQMSPGIGFQPGDQPPTASLTVTQSSSLAVNASTSGSSDPDGSVAKSTIDFGDGTVANGPDAAHTYGVTGTYDITATVFDDKGASSVIIKRMTVKPSAGGVTIFAPADGSTVNWPTSIVASATSGNPISTMKVLVDGQTTYVINRDSIDTDLKIFRGTHHIQVQATDSTGATSASDITVNAEPGDQTPTAVLTVTPMPSIAPNAVLACTANSVDPDGFFITRQIQFSDGVLIKAAGAVHTFASSGSHSATATVTDQFGASDSATDTF